jgi:hypothetical protein
MGRKAAVLERKPEFPPPGALEAHDELDAAPAVADDAPDDGLEADATITDNVGEQSIEINVESLIAELEAEARPGKPAKVQCARRKLEDYLERKRIAQQIEDFEDFVVGD